MKQNMKNFKLAAIIFVIAVVVSACGNNDGKVSDQTNSSSNTKQQEIEAENEKLKAEAEALKKELAEKQALEEKEKKDEEAAKLAAEEQVLAVEDSNKTKTADMMSMIIPFVIEGGVINDETYNYIVEHHELFPAVTVETKNAAKEQVDATITTRHLFKNVSPYLDKMVKVSGHVVQIQEDETDLGTLAEIHILDNNGNSIVGVYMNSTGDILDGDSVTMRGVPTALYSFDNIGGGTTNAILLTVSTIQKN